MVASASLDRIFRRPKVQRAVNQWAASAERESQDPTSSRSGQLLLAMNSAEPDQQCKRGCADFVNYNQNIFAAAFSWVPRYLPKSVLEFRPGFFVSRKWSLRYTRPATVQRARLSQNLGKRVHTCHWLPQIYSELISVK
ncbi:Hypothetical_protein [Hexamita inflata]|uniref:Hypothetical_protein n=1 Tax=Hexamita inflata TaxID=28002 RepID=A0AA86P0N3_9EUKA|nr:Hypothetical protein HINF_LOCUS17068 [Hexamita inflata]